MSDKMATALPDLPSQRSPRLEIARSIVVDISALAGAGLLVYGAWLAYHPAGYIVGGAALLLAGLNGARR